MHRTGLMSFLLPSKLLLFFLSFFLYSFFTFFLLSFFLGFLVFFLFRFYWRCFLFVGRTVCEQVMLSFCNRKKPYSLRTNSTSEHLSGASACHKKRLMVKVPGRTNQYLEGPQQEYFSTWTPIFLLSLQVLIGSPLYSHKSPICDKLKHLLLRLLLLFGCSSCIRSTPVVSWVSYSGGLIVVRRESWFFPYRHCYPCHCYQ